MRILVCGGRDYEDYEMVKKVLGSLFKPELIINGAAKGADTLSTRWAEENKIPCLMYPALWSKQGKQAGILRNIKMLEEGMPHMVIAFPGGRGTAHMMLIARQAGVPVWDVSKSVNFNIEDMNEQANGGPQLQ